MDHKKIIAQSWAYTQQNRGLIFWLGFIPAIFTTTVSILYVLYQYFALKNSYLFSNDAKDNFFSNVASSAWNFFQANEPLQIPLVLIVVIVVVMYILMPTFAKASAIQMIARNKNGQATTVGQAMGYGLSAFLKLFEYHLLIRTFAFFSIIFEMLFVLRNLGPGLFQFLVPLFVILMVVSVVLTLLFTYSDFFIVIDDEGVFDSIKKSSNLVVTHLRYTFLITILMLIIGIRVILQAIMIFLVPGLVILITGYLATVTLPTAGVVVAATIGIGAFGLSAYMNGIVDIFSYTVWTYTFLELSEKSDISARDTVEE